jgi:hypothetical protein
VDWWINALIAVCGYLLGMAFAGSFLGRKWMGTVDVTLHRLFKREVTLGKYLYWKHFCNINDPPKPPTIEHPRTLNDRILSNLLFGRSPESKFDLTRLVPKTIMGLFFGE